MDAPSFRPAGLSAAQVAEFESFVAGFRTVFHRADQFLRFRAYLRGLLEPSDRKNVESVAAAAAAVIMVEADLAQSLQHFVTQSPWDPRRLVAAVRQRTAEFRRDPEAVWVVHDGPFAKKGRHSVGVQRQYARAMGRKINCQIAVFVAQLGPRGYFPLAARLYLPGGWLREHADGPGGRLIPEGERTPATKSQIAARLLDELREDGEQSLPVVAEGGYATDDGFVSHLTRAGLTRATEKPDAVPEALHRFDTLRNNFGLDHFEGRTWLGWHHHVGLVFTAYHFLASSSPAGKS